MSIRRQAGVTLVELIIAMVIIGVAAAGMIGAFSTSVRGSVDPVIHKQMTAIAEGLMEEIQVKPFAVQASVAGAVRQDFNDVRDYHNYTSTGMVDIDGNAVAGLERYQVTVTAATSAILAPDVPAADTIEIAITVRNGTDVFTLTGWRTNY